MTPFIISLLHTPLVASNLPVNFDCPGHAEIGSLTMRSLIEALRFVLSFKCQIFEVPARKGINV